MANKARLSKSGVSWTDYSWGVVDGCTKVSPACTNCYAEAMAKRFWVNDFINDPNNGDALRPRKFSDVRTHPERLEAPLNTKKGGKVFVAPMGDLFHESIPFEFIDQVFAVMALCPQHTFQVLTKRPERMLEWFNYKDMAWRHESMRGDERIRFQTYHTFGQTVPSEVWQWPLKNVWLGVTAENQEQADKRIPVLLQIPAAVRFVSVEPMLGPVDLTDLHYENITAINALNGLHGFPKPHAEGPKLDLVICGGESGRNARPMYPDWARSLRDQCTAAGVKFFFKQWGEYAPFNMEKESVFYKNIAILKTGRIKTVSFDEFNYYNNTNITSALMTRFGTKQAGNLLDGQTWQQMPEVA